MPEVKGNKSGRTYKRYMNEKGTAREYTDDTGKKLTDAEFKAAEDGFTESAAGTNAGSGGVTTTQQINSGTKAQTQITSAKAPVLREEADLSISQRMKPKVTPTPTPTPKKPKTNQVSALLGDSKRRG